MLGFSSQVRHGVLCALLLACAVPGIVLAAEDEDDENDDTPPPAAVSTKPSPGVLTTEYIYHDAPFLSCHASTIVQVKSGLVAAWFGGQREGSNDVGIWVSLHDGKHWLPTFEVANGIQADGTRHPCWNPVLFSTDGKTIDLFYKVGPRPSSWWGMLKRSTDGGRTWSMATRLPDKILGPIKNKPVLLASHRLLCPSSSEHDGWKLHMEWTTDNGKTWKSTPPLNDGREFAAIQPTILKHGNRLQLLCRTRQSHIAEAWSDDSGQTWTPLHSTALPNNNSGLDAVTLSDGRSLLVYNHTTKGRHPLNVAVSKDGKTWQAAAVLERTPGEYSYPAVIESADGKVHITYTWNRLRIRHVVVDPQQLVLQEITDGQWPQK